uniref:ZZ-type domain-containing protein n=1 Tax=Corethron hystrix TaxID=216773 RepID=A0A7S1G1X9_9STRA|mmetsp:Transcript_9270/g.20491  ORF Transcript_9270/g.20491 Transcript_9270/m.20491 type:complete len:670 (+) Transcript_9270:223-2232(+)|eukprot:CAMPEP_0113314802 /NCGR_PEP_ID=MMETSP0010_2-20120614/10715_1 /TAXON_ID=216773 ORGANISM="Corethron hystrix, Strain 308" /NCGR_SAMPLE_ID=MMETSP0010_2 /ASSEMBLY_ACC=CAM_ASM_000155 /LENGTH=669 /DNA_ID=CAMNT_0000171157 /DNA_START=178 /DNA_END=2187 /DNA_ORIENTATION=- /assembly_acc=CAM_ASM_000155
MSQTEGMDTYLAVKLNINYDTYRRVSIQRLKRDPEKASFRDNISFNKLKRLAIDYLPKKEENKNDSSVLEEESAKKSPDDKQAKKPKNSYQDYIVTVTYFDEEGDEITISSDIELVEAFENFMRVNKKSDSYVFNTCAVVKRKGDEDIFDGLPLKNIRIVRMKRRAAQKARANGRKMRKRDSSSQADRKLKKKKAPSDAAIKKEIQSPPQSNCNREFDPDFIHARHTCDGCGVSPIVGFRYNAKNLINYDLCQNCKTNYDEGEKKDIIFRQAQKNSDRRFVPLCGRAIRRGTCLFQEDSNLAEAIKRSFKTLLEEKTSQTSEKRVAEVTTEVGSLVLTGDGADDSKKENQILELENDARLVDAKSVNVESVNVEPIAVELVDSESVAVEQEKNEDVSQSPDLSATQRNEQEDTKDDTFFDDDDAYISADDGKMKVSNSRGVDHEGSEADDDFQDVNMEIIEERDEEKSESNEVLKMETNEEVVDDFTEKTNASPAVETTEHIGIVCERNETQENVTPEDKDNVKEFDNEVNNVEESIIDLQPNENVDKEMSGKSGSDTEWDILDQDVERPSDELACATKLMGSSLFNSDLGTSQLTNISGRSEISSLTASSALMNRWGREVLKLRELGFSNDAQSVDVLETLYAESLDGNGDKSVTVERAVEYMVEKLT